MGRLPFPLHLYPLVLRLVRMVVPKVSDWVEGKVGLRRLGLEILKVALAVAFLLLLALASEYSATMEWFDALAG